ncbi:hypothetical protein [Asticcacaulis taihuensis]|uniref:hypothetical protein n=1 Tax=Asticcacaulis taihuensis TaxID=260084 RepID=UPI001FE1252C|nr:hypothetical protein [Asticcacaulis taihuensis]
MVEINKKAFQKKSCFAEGGDFGACEGKIINAHTVSRGPNLTKIARNGQVIQYKGNVTVFEKTGGRLKPDLIGIGQASAFNGYCAKHDRELFSCIENEPFTGRVDQLLAVAFRTLSRELHGKDASGNMRDMLRDSDKGRTFEEQLAIQHWLKTMDVGIKASQRELRATFSTLKQALAGKQPEVLRSLVLKCDAALPFMAAGAWSAFTDLNGNDIQDGNSTEQLEQLFISTFAGDPTSYICVSWLDKPGAPGKIIADQLASIAPDRQVEVFLQFVVKHVENVFFNPDWFEALAPGQRKTLDRLAASGLDSFGSVPQAALRADVTFGMPAVSRSTFVGCKSKLSG